METLNVLLVDDEKNITHTASLALRSFGCQVTIAHSAEEALLQLQTYHPDLVLTDFKLPLKTGVELIQEIQRSGTKTLMVLMTAFASFENAVEAIKSGAFDYLPKPFSLVQLEHLVQKVTRVVALERENMRLRREAGSRTQFFAGMTSPAMVQLESFIHRVAPTEATLLLTGESGVGKSVLARHVHELSKRFQKPFVEVSCTNLSESLIESELFGHSKGAFTGAQTDHMGKLEFANGGTLFLDEIGELSLASQTKFLSFLETRSIEPVGSNKRRSIDTRVIAATNRNLAEAVAKKTFREDLYFRINMLEYPIVPLRFRKEDIPVLANRVVQQLAASSLSPITPVIPESIVNELVNYSWPGNIRELRNTIERLVMLSDGRALYERDLPESLRKSNFQSKAASSDTKLELVRLDIIERNHIKNVLSIESNLEKASEILGISQTTLWRKRKEYGLE